MGDEARNGSCDIVLRWGGESHCGRRGPAAERGSARRHSRRTGVRDHSHAAMEVIAGASVSTSTRSGGSRAKASASATSSQES